MATRGNLDLSEELEEYVLSGVLPKFQQTTRNEDTTDGEANLGLLKAALPIGYRKPDIVESDSGGGVEALMASDHNESFSDYPDIKVFEYHLDAMLEGTESMENISGSIRDKEAEYGLEAKGLYFGMQYEKMLGTDLANTPPVPYIEHPEAYKTWFLTTAGLQGGNLPYE